MQNYEMSVSPEFRPLYLEIDRSSDQGSRFFRSAAATHGIYIEQVVSRAESVFLLRSPWAPGLRFVGAQAQYGDGGEQARKEVYSASGAGDCLHTALASCMGEAVERLAPLVRGGDVSLYAGLSDVHARVLPSAINPIEEALTVRGLSMDYPLGWVRGKIIVAGAEVEVGRDVLLPADWCLRIPEEQVCLPPRTALSVGVAAGPDQDWAASRALMELVERDAVGLWWVGGRPGRSLPLEQPEMTSIANLLATLRQESLDRRTWLLDITTDIGIPTVAALSCGLDGRKLAYGFATRLSIADSARAAVLELCQTELAVLLAETKLLDFGEFRLTPLDRAHLRRCSNLHVGDHEHLHPVGDPVIYTRSTNVSALSEVQDMLSRVGIEAALFDLTRPEFTAIVVRSVAPALQPTPSAVVTDRLRQTLQEFAGRSSPVTEFELI